MVKQRTSPDFDRNMYGYKMRSSHTTPMYSSRSNPSQNHHHNHVQVAHSSGCCGSRKVASVPPRQPAIVEQQSPTPQQTAHERSHVRLDKPDPYFSRYGRVRKNPNRGRKPYQSPYGKNQIHSTRTEVEPRQTNRNYQTSQPPPRATTTHAPPTAKTKKNCCCTIL